MFSGQTTETCQEQSASIVFKAKLLLSGLLALQASSLFFPHPLAWGLNHLSFSGLPQFLALLWPLGALVSMWLPRMGASDLAKVSKFARHLPSTPSRQVGLALLLVPVASLLFWVFRVKTRFLGDGELLVELVARGVPTHGFDFMTYHLHALAFDSLGLAGEHQSAVLFAITSIASGLAFSALAIWGVRSLFDSPSTRLIGYSLLLLQPHVLLFLGYPECYGPMAVGILWFSIATIRFYHGKDTALHPAIAFAGAVFLHPNALFLTPALVGIGLFPRNEHPPIKRVLRTAVLLLSPTIPLLIGMLYLSTVAPAEDSLTAAIRNPASVLLPLSGQGILSWRHWKDFVNLLLLLYPIPLALGTARFTNRRPLTNGDKTQILGVLGLLLIGATINMRLGMVRDWDILAPHVTFVALAVLDYWSRNTSSTARRRTSGPVLIASLTILLPWIAVNANAQGALTRFAAVIRDLPPYSRAYAYDELARYHRDAGDWIPALAAYDSSLAASPTNPRLRLSRAELQYHAGQPSAALDSLSAVVKDHPTYAPATRALIHLLMKEDSLATALELSRSLRRFSTEPEDAILHGRVADKAGFVREGMEAYAQALHLDPSSVKAAEALVALMVSLDGIQSVQNTLREAHRRQPDSVQARLCLAVSLLLPIQRMPQALLTPATTQDLVEAEQLLSSLPPAVQRTDAVHHLRALARSALDSLLRE